MKKKFLLFTIFILLCSFFVSWDYNSNELVGIYLTNFERVENVLHIRPAAPLESDTLYIYKDGSFKSGYFGVGIYYIKNNSILRHNSITLISNKQDMQFQMLISKRNIYGGVPQFDLSTESRNYYYQKIK
jgi:hypothetical protein